MRPLHRKLILITLLVICIFTAGIGLVIYHRTLIAWWIVLVIGLAFSAATSPALLFRWAKLTGNNSTLLSAIVHLTVTCIIASTIFLTTNYFFANQASETKVETTVTDKYRKEHQKRRRVGRNRYINDGVRYSYHLTLTLPDGREKEMEVNFSEYRRTKTGNRKTTTTRKGLYGFTIIKR